MVVREPRDSCSRRMLVRSASVRTSPFSTQTVPAGQVGGVADAAAGAEGLGLDHVAQPDAEPLAVAEGPADVVHPVGAGQDDVGDPVGAQQRELVGEERVPEQRNHRLGPLQRQRPQPRALAPGQDDGLGGRRYGPGDQGSASLMSITGMPSRIG